MSDTMQSLDQLSALKTASPESPKYVKKVDKQGRAYATGKRKDAVARVWVKPGTGQIVINGRDQAVYFARDVVVEFAIRVLFELAAAPSDQAVNAASEIRAIHASANRRREVGSVGQPSRGAVRHRIALDNGLAGDRTALGQVGAITIPEVEPAVEEILPQHGVICLIRRQRVVGAQRSLEGAARGIDEFAGAKVVRLLLVVEHTTDNLLLRERQL